MAESQELLASFARDRSEAAFRELVARYLDLVYSTAVRLVDGDTHRAEDVSQMVFADLARMAGKLSGSASLGGWLHRHTCFVARTVMRGERRRQARERHAAEMTALNQDHGLTPIAPILDEAIQELGPDDRDVILLRFFERLNLRAVGEALGTTENVAQKRVSRAVQELGILLKRRGVSLSAAALAGSLAAGAVSAAPAGLAFSIAAGAFAAAGVGPGLSTAAAKVAVVTKAKWGVITVIIVAGILTGIVLHQQFRGRMQKGPPMDGQEGAELKSAGPRGARAGNLTPSAGIAMNGTATGASPSDRLTRAGVQAAPAITAFQENTSSVALPVQRFAAGLGSRVRIEGTSNLGDWQVQGTIIGGFLEVGPGFPSEPGQAVEPGPVQAQAEAFIPVRSLKSIEKDGRPYSDKMDEIIYENLREQQDPRIHYYLGDLSLKGTTNHDDVLEYEFESRGSLVVAGVTNEIALPVFVLPLGNDRFTLSGSTQLSMKSFGIEPPGSKLRDGAVKAGDSVKVFFEWVVQATAAAAAETQKGLVPLVLDLPKPAFKTLPRDLQIGADVAALSDRPRAPLMVPPGLLNLAPGSTIASSDNNVTAESLAKIADGDKSASESSIIFLRKGLQWVQMDLGSPHDLFAIVIWHAHNAAKIYHDVIVQVCDEPGFHEHVRTLFNNDRDNTSGLGRGSDREYIETYEGKLINARGTRGRYLRFYSKGSTESALNEYTEIEVHGRDLDF